jgi:PAS domain S-box-containing protein
VVVAIVSAGAYLVQVWSTAQAVGWADVSIRLVVLIGAPLGVGLIGELERAESAETRRLRRAAIDRELFIRDVVESLGEGVVVLNDASRIMMVNAIAEARHGVAGSEVVGRDYFRAFPELDDGRLRPQIDRLLRGESERFVLDGVEQRRPSGERLIMTIAGSVFRRRGRPAGVVLVGQDVTERVALEESARRADKLAALGTLAAGLAHELNNPIGIISARIEVMLMEAQARSLPAALVEDLRVLQRHALRVARIARGLLSFARPGRGQSGPVDLNQVVEETLALAERQISRAGVTVRRGLAPGLPPIPGHADTLQQVVLNLVKNAADAIEGEGEIRIETRSVDTPPGGVQLVVSDTGRGIPPEAISRIFDPFYTTKTDGTGLGLSVSHGIVRDHGGTIDVQSRPGAGTTFVLTFPVTLSGGNE